MVFPDEAGRAPLAGGRPLELGDSFAANARAKAEYFSKQTGLPTVADDSGLEVFALGGEPGVRSRRWAGAGRNRKSTRPITRSCVRLSERRRRVAARYRCVLVYLPRTRRGAEGIRRRLFRTSWKPRGARAAWDRSPLSERRSWPHLRRGLSRGEGCGEPSRTGAPSARRGTGRFRPLTSCPGPAGNAPPYMAPATATGTG